jgi:hypothetical protein
MIESNDIVANKSFAEYIDSSLSHPSNSESQPLLQRMKKSLQAFQLLPEAEDPASIALNLHDQVAKIHQVLVQESNADINVRRLSYQNLLLSFQLLLAISLQVAREEIR